jgi:hypothetical protein
MNEYTSSNKYHKLFLEKVKQFNDIDTIISYPLIKEELLSYIDEEYGESNPVLYKQKYETLTGLKVPKNFIIHHINCNRDDDRITNLVAIPLSIHSLYHKKLSFMNMTLTPQELNKPIIDLSFHDTGGTEVTGLSIVEKMTEFFELQQKGCFWVGYRNALLSIIPFWPVYNYVKY